MTSRTWYVLAAGEKYVAKLVPAAAQAPFVAGLAVAEHLAAGGIATGPPVRTASGALALPLGGSVLALLRYQPGEPLDRRDPMDQRSWGDLLGRAHRRLDGFSHPGLVRWHWVRADAAHLGIEPWVRPAVSAAVDALTRLGLTGRLTYGVLHGDPAPEAFLLDGRTGRTALIDWGSACTGPLMYDVASAVMYAGGPERATALLDGYLAAGPVGRDELEATLPTLLRFRWAVQADWFAGRIATRDETGNEDPRDNWTGLYHARDSLAARAP